MGFDIKIKITKAPEGTISAWWLWRPGDCIKAGSRDTILKEIEMEMKRVERNGCVDLDLPQIYQYEKGGE